MPYHPAVLHTTGPGHPWLRLLEWTVYKVGEREQESPALCEFSLLHFLPLLPSSGFTRLAIHDPPSLY